MNDDEISLRGKAREYGMAEAETLQAWNDMVKKYHLPNYAYPVLEKKANGCIALSPGVDLKYLPELLETVPDFENIPCRVWEKVGG